MRENQGVVAGERGGSARTRTFAGAAAAALLAGCSAAPPSPPSFAPPDPPPARAPVVESAPADPRTEFHLAQADSERSPSRDRDTTDTFGFKRFSIDAEWIPAMWVTADVDQKGSPQTRGDLDTGSGLLLRAGMGTEQQNIGLLYMGTWHEEKTTGRGASTQSVLLDFLYRAPLPETGGAVWLEVDAGLGGTELQFDSSQFDSQLTGSALLHGDLEFRVTRAFTLAAGAGAFIWGNPGDTIAYGSYVTLGAKLIF